MHCQDWCVGSLFFVILTINLYLYQLSCMVIAVHMVKGRQHSAHGDGV